MAEAPLPLEIGWNRNWCAVVAAACLPFAGLSAWAAWSLMFGRLGRDADELDAAIQAALFAAFVVLFLAASLTYALACFDRTPVVVVSAAGIRDRRLSRRTIAWSDLAAAAPFRHNGQDMLVLSLRPGVRPPQPANPLWIANRFGARRVGREFSVKTTGLTHRLAPIVEALEAHAGATASQPLARSAPDQ